MYENKLEFPGWSEGGGGGAKQKTFRGGNMDIFWNCTFRLSLSAVQEVMVAGLRSFNCTDRDIVICVSSQRNSSTTDHSFFKKQKSGLRNMPQVTK